MQTYKLDQTQLCKNFHTLISALNKIKIVIIIILERGQEELRLAYIRNAATRAKHFLYGLPPLFQQYSHPFKRHSHFVWNQGDKTRRAGQRTIAINLYSRVWNPTSSCRCTFTMIFQYLMACHAAQNKTHTDFNLLYQEAFAAKIQNMPYR